tara:strand:- start:765 stop:938 length:174 start_codon:yes stop_codon:yes gene_type:complete
MTVSNIHNEAIMERLYDEAYEFLVNQKPIPWPSDMDKDTLHRAAVELAKKRFEFDYD